MWIGIISLFPDMFHVITNYGITGKAIKNGLLTIHSWNPRNFTDDRRNTVDDRPYGGGPGMIIMAQPLKSAILEAKYRAGKGVSVIYLSPHGRRINQDYIKELANNTKLILVCGRYEGIDERIVVSEIDEELSVGDYVFSGGEIPAMALIDLIARFIPGVLGHKASVVEDSFANGLLDYPHYTRPKIFDGMQVPSVLLSGNHDQIRRWRLKQSLGRTWLRRPDLLHHFSFTREQMQLLEEFKTEYKQE